MGGQEPGKVQKISDNITSNNKYTIKQNDGLRYSMAEGEGPSRQTEVEMKRKLQSISRDEFNNKI